MEEGIIVADRPKEERGRAVRQSCDRCSARFACFPGFVFLHAFVSVKNCL